MLGESVEKIEQKRSSEMFKNCDIFFLACKA